MFYAFSEQQFAEGMQKLLLHPKKDRQKVLAVVGGAFIRKEDYPALLELFNRQNKEVKAAALDDLTGHEFSFQMFRAELSNYEYGYTRDLTDTLNAVPFTLEEINSSTLLLEELNKAIKDIISYEDE